VPAVPSLLFVEDSALWKQIEQYAHDHPGERAAVDTLKANVRIVTREAAKLGSLVVRHMPEYTDHGERHYLNVAAIMGALLPPETLARLHPVECALCLLAAYTHDLGMVLRADELEAIRSASADTPERKAWERFLDRHGEERRQLDRWRAIERDPARAEDARARIGQIDDYLLATYIRETHTDKDLNRVQKRLGQIADEVRNASLYTYAPDGARAFDFKRPLALIGLSHGHGVDWLRKQLGSKPTDFYRRVGPARVNLALPGLLLRLADVMDFDASRAPGLLFRHIGIENDVSLREWRKHMAITGWDLDVSDRPSLTYEAEADHPVVEKTIRSFGRTIENELRDVQAELTWLNRQIHGGLATYALRLPETVKVDVRAAEDEEGRPCYHYADIEFRLDQDEILQLLMGESLYGDPSLCIRELIQNSLDALQLRDLRLKLDAQDETPAEPVDRLRRDETLEVVVEWGHDDASGQDFLRVRDNGVGMTEDAIKRYFTQIGKSYYRASEFEREKAMLRRHGLLATPISQFGIGILSCFMIADRLEVRTRPGGADAHERAPYDVTISGPGSLFWLREGTRDTQGTEITLYLKAGYRLMHDADTLHDRLRDAFGYSGAFHRAPSESTGEGTPVDPAFVVGRYVVWPMYPVRLAPPGVPEVTINDRFHPVVLAPLDVADMSNLAPSWGESFERLGEPSWSLWDWTDDTESVSDDAPRSRVTGSRIRIWTPQSRSGELPFSDPADDQRMPQNLLAGFAERTLERSRRTELLVKGMHVPDTSEAAQAIQIASGVGTRVWLDFRGDASPMLRADRQAARRHPDEDWPAAVSGVIERALAALALPDVSRAWCRNARTGLRTVQHPLLDCEAVSHSIHAVSTNLLGHFILDLALDRALGRARDLDLDLALDRARDLLSRDLDLLRALDRARDLDLDRARDLALDLAHDLDLARVLDLARDLHLDRGLARVRTRAHDLARIHALARDLHRDLDRHLARARARAPLWLRTISPQLIGAFLQEAFFPTLEQSWPHLECFALRGRVGDARLTSPTSAYVETESDGRAVHFTDPDGHTPASLVGLGYDLCFPMVAIPLGALRRTCEDWRTDRRFRPLGTAPFLFPGWLEVWPRHTEILGELFYVESIYALFPDERLWTTPFEDWTAHDWTTGYSALWDITTGEVFWARGAHPRAEMREIGVSTFNMFTDLPRPNFTT